eukprot:1186189-Prorocentrum_minimum.AAC.7
MRNKALGGLQASYGICNSIRPLRVYNHQLVHAHSSLDTKVWTSNEIIEELVQHPRPRIRFGCVASGQWMGLWVVEGRVGSGQICQWAHRVGHSYYIQGPSSAIIDSRTGHHQNNPKQAEQGEGAAKIFKLVNSRNFKVYESFRGTFPLGLLGVVLVVPGAALSVGMPVPTGDERACVYPVTTACSMWAPPEAPR